jgi:E3 ubiquitin-protein ligase MARCH6
MLFWFADGGWSFNQSDTSVSRSTTAMRALELAHQRLTNISTSLMANGTSPTIPPVLANPTTSASVGTIMDALPSLMNPFSQTLNATAGDPLIWGMLKTFWYGMGLQMTSSLPHPPSGFNSSLLESASTTLEHSSLLGNVKFLNNLTRHPSINRLIISTLEGQIITVLVVISFILVFLIREWVVQQQPGINIGAGFQAEFVGGFREAQERDILNPGQQPEVIPAELPQRQRDEDAENAARVADRPIARPRRRVVRLQPAPPNEVAQVDDSDYMTTSTSSLGSQGPANGEGSSSSASASQPSVVMRDALSPAADIQRRLTNESPRIAVTPNVTEFLSIWRRADGNPERVLQIIEEDGKGQDLDYWVRAMKVLTRADGLRDSDSSPRQSIATERPELRGGGSDHSSGDSWVDVVLPPQPLNVLKNTTNVLVENSQINTVGSPSSNSKGKGKATADFEEPDLRDSNEISYASPESPEGHAELPRPSSPKPVPFTFNNDRSRPPFAEYDNENKSPVAHNWSFSAIQNENQSIDAPSTSDYDIWKSAEDRRVHEVMEQARRNLLARRATTEPDAENTPSSSDAHDSSQNALMGSIIAPETKREPELQLTPEHHVFDSSDDEEFLTEPPHEDPEPNPFHPDGPMPPLREPLVQREAEAQGFLGHIAEWMWGGVVPNPQLEGLIPNDEQVVDDVDAEAPFVAVGHGHGRALIEEANAEDQDRGLLGAGFDGGVDPNDQDALEDAEDFDGIMELIGMRGPWTGLLQNGMFSAVLISLTLCCGVWIPYNIGRLGLLLFANPISATKLPLKLVLSCAELLVDIGLAVSGFIAFTVLALASLPSALFSISLSGPNLSPSWGVSGVATKAWLIAVEACERITGGAINGVIHISDSEVPDFSAASHEALILIKQNVSANLEAIGRDLVRILTGDLIGLIKDDSIALWSHATHVASQLYQAITALPILLMKPTSLVISLEMPQRAAPLDPGLAHWGGFDRFWAIIAGYTVLTLLGALYLRRGTPFSSSHTGRQYEAQIADILNQAGGVMKVILIISIEMLVFPLYCGLLLDVALLPLFHNATIMSRILFTYNSPLTSIFVHWFVGTCYMFHFALFVSMCRKIMRKGVLCKSLLFLHLKLC